MNIIKNKFSLKKYIWQILAIILLSICIYSEKKYLALKRRKKPDCTLSVIKKKGGGVFINVTGCGDSVCPVKKQPDILSAIYRLSFESKGNKNIYVKICDNKECPVSKNLIATKTYDEEYPANYNRANYDLLDEIYHIYRDNERLQEKK